MSGGRTLVAAPRERANLVRMGAGIRRDLDCRVFELLVSSFFESDF